VVAASQGGNAGQVLQVVFSSLGLFVALIVGLVAGILIYRGRRAPDSRMRAVIDAGFKAVPGLVAVIAGVVGFIVGVAYLLILFIYWLVYFVFASIWVGLAGGTVTYPAEFGQLAGQGVIYMGLGVLVAALGAVWLGLVVAGAVRGVQRRLRGSVYPPAAQPAPRVIEMEPVDTAPPEPSRQEGRQL
jgi:hypothetical protein